MEVDKCFGSYETGKHPAITAAIEKWGDSVVEDGSLHTSTSHEVNTQPTNGDRFLEHIKDLTDAYAGLSAVCSEACGLHVHINAKDLNFYDMRKVLAIYARVERALFELCSRSRLNGTYSQICGYNYLNMSPDPRIFKRQMFGTLYMDRGRLLPQKGSAATGKLIVDARGDKAGVRDHGLRYRALNIHSFFHRGSIEFRHHEGTVDYTEITNWALICGHVIEAAAKMSEAQIIALPSETHEALLAVIPERFHKHCNTRWETEVMPATICNGARTKYARSDDREWREYDQHKGTLPKPDSEPAVVAEKKSCTRCAYPNPSTRTYCLDCGGQL